MSFLAKLASSVGIGAGQPAQQQQQNAPIQKQEAIPDNSATSPAQVAAAQPSTNPLDMLGDLWSQPSAAQSSAQTQFDPKEIQATAKNLNFGSLITPEHSAAIAGGGEGAVKAFSDVINSLGQAVFAASSMQAGNFVNTGLGKFQSNLDSSLPNLLKSQQAQSSLLKQSDILQHPSVQPIASAVMKQLQTKFPNASAEDLAGATQEYLQQFGNAFKQIDSPAEQAKSKPQSLDWESLLS